MACCRKQATSHDLEQWWSSLLTHICVTQPQLFVWYECREWNAFPILLTRPELSIHCKYVYEIHTVDMSQEIDTASEWKRPLLTVWINMYIHFIFFIDNETWKVVELRSYYQTSPKCWFTVSRTTIYEENHLRYSARYCDYPHTGLVELTRWSPNKIAPCYDNFFKLNENWHIMIKISLKFVSNGHVNNNTALDQKNGFVSKRRQVIIWTNDGFIPWRIYVPFGLDELTCEILSVASKPYASLRGCDDRCHVTKGIIRRSLSCPHGDMKE